LEGLLVAVVAQGRLVAMEAHLILTMVETVALVQHQASQEPQSLGLVEAAAVQVMLVQRLVLELMVEVMGELME
jgi:hypothetical protein